MAGKTKTRSTYKRTLFQLLKNSSLITEIKDDYNDTCEALTELDKEQLLSSNIAEPETSSPSVSTASIVCLPVVNKLNPEVEDLLNKPLDYLNNNLNYNKGGVGNTKHKREVLTTFCVPVDKPDDDMSSLVITISKYTQLPIDLQITSPDTFNIMLYKNGKWKLSCGKPHSFKDK